MTSTLTAVARTLSQELERSVAAAEAAQNAGLNEALTALQTARRKRAAMLANVESMQQEAAELIAEAMKLRERTEAEFTEALDAVDAIVVALKVPERARVNGARSEALPPSGDESVGDV